MTRDLFKEVVESDIQPKRDLFNEVVTTEKRDLFAEAGAEPQASIQPVIQKYQDIGNLEYPFTTPEGPLDAPLKAGMKELWEGIKATPETIGAIGTGIPLWAIGKLRGTGELLRGHSEEQARQVEEDIAAKGIQPKTKAGKSAVDMVGKVMDVITWPARLAGETAKDLGYPKSGYLIELAGELASFKMMGEVKGVSAKQLKQRATAKSVFYKKMSALTEEQKTEVRKIADTQVKGRNLIKEENQNTLTPMEVAYEVQKDIWFQKKDGRLFEADIESRLLKKEIKTSVPSGIKKVRKKNAPAYDEAIQIYIDLKSHPEHLDKYYDVLTNEQKKVVDLSQNLPPEIKTIADKIADSYRVIGNEAQDAGVIRNMIDNYAGRQWDLGPGKSRQALKKFGTTTGHAKARRLGTVLEGWAEGYDLKIKSATENLRAYKQEVIRTMADKEFVTELRKIKDLDGKPLLSTNQFEGYVPVEHPNMTAWEWAGTSKRGMSVSPEFFQELKNLAEEIKDLRIKTEKETVTKTKSESTVSGGALAEGGPLAKMESVIRDALMTRGMTEGESNVYIRKLKSKGEGAVNEIIKDFSEKTETQKTTLESKAVEGKIGSLSQPKEIETGKLYGKNFFATEDGTIFERRRLYAPKREAQNVNNMLGISKLSEVPGIKGITKFNAITKAWILQSSLFHHMAFMRSYYLPGGFKGKWETPRQAYKSGIKSIEISDPVLVNGVRNGLTIGLKQDWSESLLRESTVIGRQLDKVKATKIVKDKINKFREGQADFLFGEFGAGLKAKAYILEYRHQMKKHPNSNPDVVAKRVANLINDDFGGLHLQRMGRNPTAQHIFRLFALAPDWTESNVRTMAKTMKNMTVDQAELTMYRKFWGGVVVKGLGVTALANYALAGGDVKQMTDNYKKAWKSGNFNWMKVDITPIYEAMGGDSGQSKYFGAVGHFQDPAKFIVHPIKSLKHKQSVVAGIGFEALSGTDYTGVRSFNTLEDLLKERKTVSWGKGGPIDWDQFPAYALSQIAGTQPIQIQALMQWMAGEQEGFDALSQSIGLRTTTTYKQKSRIRKGLRKLKGTK